MKPLWALFLFTTLIACSQNQETKKYIPNPKAKLLNDSAINIATKTPPKNFELAISLLDEATRIDSNYYSAFNSKISFQLNLNRYSDALITAKNMIRIKPESPMNHFITGMIFWKLQDSVSANASFLKSAELSDKMLAGMSKSDKKYDGAMLDKAINLILIGQEETGYGILKELYNKHTNDSDKQFYEHYMNKSRKEILDEFFNSESTDAESEPVIKD